MVEINFKCENCGFSFLDKNLIFYLDTDLDDLESILNFNLNDENADSHLKLIEASHNKENSDKMTKSLISGFLYENYCPHCNELIKTYVPESNELFTQEEIEKILAKEISKNSFNEENTLIDEGNSDYENKAFKILFFDFKNTFYKDRRNILENNHCPNCNGEMSLVISEKTPCPICGSSLKEEF